MTLRPYIDQKLNDLPHIILTLDTKWDPSTLDHAISSDEDWCEITVDHHKQPSLMFDLQENYRHRHTIYSIHIEDNNRCNRVLPSDALFYGINENMLIKEVT